MRGARRWGGDVLTGVAVTGATGYIGGRLVGVLAADTGRRVTAVTRAPVPWLPAAVEQRPVDLLGPIEAIKGAFLDADVVLHLAGANEVETGHDPDRTTADTIAAARRVGEAAVAAGVDRIVYISTIHVYGGSMRPGVVITEDLLPSPVFLYAVTRLACEHVLAATTGSSAELVVFRLTNAVGAPADASIDRWSLVANDLCRQAVIEGRLELRTHGAQWRDFIAMSEVCRIVAQAVPGPRTPPVVPSGLFNLGSGRPMTIRELTGVVQDSCETLTGRRPPLVAPDLPPQAPGPYRVAADRLAGLGITVEDRLREAVDETIRFCQQERGRL